MNTQSLLISVIIPTYLRPSSLKRCLISLSKQEYPKEKFEVLIINDGGEPSSVEDVTAELQKELNISFLHQTNQGVAGARKFGIKHSRGKILVFLDDDCSVPEDYLANIEKAFQSYSEHVAVQPLLDNPEPDNIYGQVWKFVFEETLKANLQTTLDGRITCGILGGVMVAHREVFSYVDYDASFNLSREDADLRYQIHNLNIPVYYEPEIKVFHYCRKSLRQYFVQNMGYGRGQLRLQHKWSKSTPPFCSVNLISLTALRSLMNGKGIKKGLTIYLILWIKRIAFLTGKLQGLIRDK